MESWQKGLAASVLFSLILVGSVFFYARSQAQVLAKSQEDQALVLSKRIDDLKEAQVLAESRLLAKIETESTSLKKDQADLSSALKKSITDLGGSIESVKKESKETAKILSGQLQSVQEQSQEKLGEIEEQLLNVNVKSESFAGIVDKAIKSVVAINTDVGVGSGAIIDSEGYIITNRHVIEGATQGSVKTADGVHHQIRMVKKSDQADLALLQMTGTYPALNFGSSSNIAVGSRVVAMGSPAGLEFTVSEGIVSAKRTIGAFEYIQTDLSLNPGNSGGPLINPRGEIVGINTIKLKDFEGLGFALTAEEARDFALDAVLTDKKAREAQAQAAQN